MSSSVVVEQKISQSKKVFINDLVWVLSVQIAFQVIFTGLLTKFADFENSANISYINTSGYFLIFLLSLRSLKYTIANRPLVLLFMAEFLYLSLSSTLLMIWDPPSVRFEAEYNAWVAFYQINLIIIRTLTLFITSYLFFYSISPKKEENKKHLYLASGIVVTIILLSFSNVQIFADYANLGQDFFYSAMDKVMVNAKYVDLINLSFLLFIWFTYNQGQYLLSEYLPSIISIHTLMITNEIYQLHSATNLIENYIPALYFNAIVNLGFILLWLIRLNYLSKSESKKNERYVLNYDLLKGFVDKPHRSFWESVLIKLGKQRLYIGSAIIFFIITIPLIFLGDIDFFMRFNIILMFLFIVGVLIYAIIYTQRKWHNHIGFLIRRDKNKKD